MKLATFTATLGVLLIGLLSRQALAEPDPDPDRHDARPLSSDEDLATAADVVAEVATIPPAAAPPATAAASASDDADLAALGLDPSSGEPFDDKLNIYGFADFIYYVQHFTRGFAGYPTDGRTFSSGNLNLYLSKNLSARLRSLVEVRFTYLPNASLNNDLTAKDDTVYDSSDFGRPVQWGSIVIERALIEYDITPYLTIRAGHWLTPYGIWNVDHGSPVIIASARPYIIGEQFFPEHQTGIDLFGSVSRSGYKVGYHATASNGRGGAEAQGDQDSKLAFGGRLELTTPWGLRVGSSYYRGRYTGLTTTLGVPPETYLERAYGGDIQYDRGPLHFQAEAIMRERHYPETLRSVAASGTGFAADERDMGYYALLGYRFNTLWNVMPFTYFENYMPGDHTVFTAAHTYDAGLNFRPLASFVLKVETAYTIYPHGIGVLDGSALLSGVVQAAWVF